MIRKRIKTSRIFHLNSVIYLYEINHHLVRMFAISSVSELVDRLRHVSLQFRTDGRPMPYDYNTGAAREKLSYVNDKVDALIDSYDKEHRQSVKHPDVISQVKIAIVDILITLYWKQLSEDDDERPIPDQTIKLVFDKVYLGTFINCILPDKDINDALQKYQNAKTRKTFAQVLETKETPPVLPIVQETSYSFEQLFALNEPKEVKPIIEDVNESEKTGDFLFEKDKKFRSPEEAVFCKIEYNNEKIKFLEAQYELLELYMKRIYCEELTHAQRLEFRQKTKHSLKTITCEFSNETPGALTTLFDKFTELMFIAEKSKEALGANGMSI